MHCLFRFVFNATATTEIYTLSLHDALPISATGTAPPRARSRPPAGSPAAGKPDADPKDRRQARPRWYAPSAVPRSEEHTSELQSRLHLVCRLLLEKKKKTYASSMTTERADS